MLSKIRACVKRVVNQFQDNPYQFLYENDIQCALFAELRNSIREMIPVPSRTGRKDYLLHSIYSEYPSGPKFHQRIDLVCLDRQVSVNNNEDPWEGHDTYIYHLPVLVGIELKYVTMGYSKGINIVVDDYRKLQELENVRHRLALCFLQYENMDQSMGEGIVPVGPDNGEIELDKAYVISPSGMWEVRESLLRT